jgi:hypothetical protein
VTADTNTLITAASLVISSFIAAGGIVVVAVLTRKANVVEQKVDANADSLAEVHGLVNDQLDQVMDKNTDLTEQLKYAKTQPAEEPEP